MRVMRSAFHDIARRRSRQQGKRSSSRRAQPHTASNLDAARQTLSDEQAAANAAAEEISDAEGRLGRIDTLETQIAVTQQRVDELDVLVRERAVAAYRNAGDTGVGVVLDAADPLEAVRRTRLLDRANRKDHVAARKLASLRSDLDSQRNEVRAQRDEQKRLKDELDVKNAAVQARLVAAGKARDDLIVLLEAERAAEAAAAAELARLRAAQAAATAAQAAAAQAAAAQAAARQSGGGGSGSGGGGSGGGGGANAGDGGAPGQIIANPGGGSFQCPVNGAASSHNDGNRGGGFHYGIDMFSSTGTPLVAVKAGTVRYLPNEGAGGNTVSLSADDGNVYFYAHLSSFVGEGRSVAQGEIIGLVGATGNASGPHLHFEIRVGGANGQRTNPYPTLQGAGC
jgi:murein DD-endopeptidase MepM/ murein hydrolase activator NlpD